MKKKPAKLAILAAVVIGAVASSSLAGDAIDAGGFGEGKLTNISPVPISKAKTEEGRKECVSFEASFSEPLDKNPSAMLDIERHFTNLLNAFLEVTKISDKKYRMALTASTAEGCPTIEDESRLTISTYSGREKQDERQILPQSVTFKADKKARLKKE